MTGIYEHTKVAKRSNVGFGVKIMCSEWGSLVTERAIGLLRSFNSIKGQTPIQLKKYLRWCPPPNEYLKLNIDGAMFCDLKKVGIGMILSNENGEVLMAASKVENEGDNPEIIELLAVFQGMQMRVGRFVMNLIVESYYLLLVDSLNKNDMLDFELGALYGEVMRRKTCFASCSFTHVFREGNLVAHSLARYTWNVENIEIWEDCIPNFLSQALWPDKCL
ncbi:uncharacterized protein LOC122316220 [Carya illinoinensis]|uniref:uncharacterized protein LOC122316220 n=1 Tax=Carya illinoinensis TaxID=32201 RepID=UPI001C719055|nr:uncharacterized protein LOC122316220 [Carya illinoinensis]